MARRKRVEQSKPDNVPDDPVRTAAFHRKIGWFGVLLVLSIGAAIWWTYRSSGPVRVPPENGASDHGLSAPSHDRIIQPAVDLPRLPFRDITRESGLDFVHENGSAGEKLLPETMGGGVGVLDYNGDGHMDLVFVNSTHWPWSSDTESPPATCRLYKNDGRGRFTDVTHEAGFDVELYGMGCAIGDYDNDGDPDVFLSAVGSNRLLRNDDGRFVDVTGTAGVAGPADAWSTGCGWFDYDGDGRLDLFVCNYVAWSRELDAAQRFRLRSGGRAYGRPQQFAGQNPQLFRNRGDGTFEDVSTHSGITVSSPNDRPKSLGVTFADFDGDGDLDFVVANDTVPNLLFENRGDGTFAEIGRQSGIAFDADGNVRGAMGVDTAMFRDGAVTGIAIGNFANEMTALYVATRGTMNFVDAAHTHGIGQATRRELTFGVLLADLDLDGRADLFATNGHLEPEIGRAVAGQHYEQPAQLFWNCSGESGLKFCQLSANELGHDLLRPNVGRGAAYADFDSDGDLDLVVTAAGRPARLYRNDLAGDRRWLRLKLVGSKSNRDAIGATVTVTDSGSMQVATVMPTRSYLSQVEPVLTFGFGTNRRDTPIGQIEIRWPAGTTTVLRNVEPNRLQIIKEP